MYSRHPERPAKFVVDLALTKKYTSEHGVSVDIDPTPQTEAAEKGLGNGVRNHASEIFQVAAVNLAYAEKGLSIKYDAFATGASSSERLFDSANKCKTARSVSVARDGLTRANLCELRYEALFLLLRYYENASCADWAIDISGGNTHYN